MALAQRLFHVPGQARAQRVPGRLQRQHKIRDRAGGVKAKPLQARRQAVPLHKIGDALIIEMVHQRLGTLVFATGTGGHAAQLGHVGVGTQKLQFPRTKA